MSTIEITRVHTERTAAAFVDLLTRTHGTSYFQPRFAACPEGGERSIIAESSHPDADTDMLPSLTASLLHDYHDCYRAMSDLLAAAQAVMDDLDRYARTHGPGPDTRRDSLAAAVARAEWLAAKEVTS